MHDSRDDLAMRVIADLVHLLVHEIRDIKAMSDNTDSKLDELAAVIDSLQAGVSTEIQQLADAVTGAVHQLNPAQIARFDGIRARLQAMVDALKADDAPAGGDTTSGGGTGPGPVATIDPTALANAIAEAHAAGATPTQLQPISALGDGVSPQITKQQLADAVAAAQVPDGSERATAEQLAPLLALTA